jgi:hypothetical protein
VKLLDAGALCRQLVPEGSVYALLADHRSELFPDELFEDLFPSCRGRPSVPAGVMASAMILKELEGVGSSCCGGVAVRYSLEGGLRSGA